MTTDDAYTTRARLCDDEGLVSHELVPERQAIHPGLTYYMMLNNLRARSSPPLPPFDGEPFVCTGSAHLAGEHICCTSPAHTRAARESYSDAIGADAPAAYLRLNDSSGDAGRAADATGANDGTYEPPPPIHFAVTWDGSNLSVYVNGELHRHVTPGEAWTLTWWTGLDDDQIKILAKTPPAQPDGVREVSPDGYARRGQS